MLKLRTLSKLKGVKGKRVLVRVDFNVKVGLRGEISEHDDDRIKAAMPTIGFLVGKGAKVILISHLGRPEKREPKFSLLPASRMLSDLMRRPVHFCGDVIDDGTKVDARISAMKNGDILMLENIRYYKGEESNSPFFAKRLAELADVYVNDAFAVCHRNHASVTGVAQLLPSYAGGLIEREVAQLSKLFDAPKHPFVVLMGGSKVSTKLPVIENFLASADKILVGGGMANNFYRALGYSVGKSIWSRNDTLLAKKLLKEKKIELPRDVVVADRVSADAKVRVTTPDKVKGNETIVDIGPESMRYFAQILKEAQTIIWNGPLGIYEVPRFANGSVILARVIASRSSGKAFGVVGGGDSLPVLSMTGMGHFVDHVSTGGGAMLEFLGGKELPGLVVLSGKYAVEKAEPDKEKPAIQRVAKKEVAVKPKMKKAATKKKVTVTSAKVERSAPPKKKSVTKRAVKKKEEGTRRLAAKKNVAPKKKPAKKATKRKKKTGPSRVAKRAARKKST